MSPARLLRTAAIAASLAALGLVAHARQEPGQDQPQAPARTRSEFMRQKLEFTKSVLEGLTVENYELIERNGKLLKRLSTASEWEVTSIPNVEEYLPYTTEFQRLCDELMKAGRDRNIDAATLAYVRLATNCVNCHKYVRAHDH
jgi:hypothetical protein